MPLKYDIWMILVICAFLFVNLFFFNYYDIFWDSAVYIGMGKYVWSFGSIGLWEPARPILWPLILGLFWKIKLNITLFGRLLSILTGIISIYFVYNLIRKFGNKNAAIIFSLFFSLSIPLIKFSSKILADIPSMFFSLAAIYLIVKKERFFIPGVLIGLAALTKFTHLIFFPVIILAVILKKEARIRNAAYAVLGFSIPIAPFILFNYLSYNDPIYSFVQAKWLIEKVVLNYTSPTSVFFYLKNIFIENPFTALSLIPIFIFLKSKDWKLALVITAMLFPLVYHSSILNYKHIRYSVIFLPYLFILAGWGYSYLIGKTTKVAGYFLFFLALIQVGYSFSQIHNEFSESIDIYSDFYNYIGNNQIKGKTWSTTPAIASVKDIKIDELMYYPVWDNKKIDKLDKKLDNETIQFIFINSCDIPCVNYDYNCPKKTGELMEKISRNFNMEFSKNTRVCKLRIYRQKNGE